jgi:branched-chain amino acid transport system permease protein
VRGRVLLGFLGALVLLGLLPNLEALVEFPRFYLILLFTVFFWVAQASSWNILTGYTGYFSFGQGAFYGIGVYTTSVLAVKHGWQFVLALPLAGVTAGLFGLLLGLVVFRLRRLSGEIFALTTLAVAFVLASVARLTSAIDGGVGIFVTGTPLPAFLGDFTTAMYRLTLVIAVLTVMVSYLMYDSRVGWGLFAIGDDEPVAQGLGVPTFRYKMIALGTSGLLAGLMGGVWALQLGFVTVEDVFNIRVPLFVILMSVLGGMRHWMGPVVGAVLITTFNDRLNSAGLADVNQFLTGTLLIVLALAVREGLYARLRERWLASILTFGLVAGAVIALAASGSLITDLAYALLATVLMLLIPSSTWARLVSLIDRRDGEGGGEGHTREQPEVGTRP